jgi:hypothetical protein
LKHYYYIQQNLSGNANITPPSFTVVYNASYADRSAFCGSEARQGGAYCRFQDGEMDKSCPAGLLPETFRIDSLKVDEQKREVISIFL